MQSTRLLMASSLALCIFFLTSLHSEQALPVLESKESESVKDAETNTIYRNNPKNREFGKEAPQNFQAKAVQSEQPLPNRQGASEHENFEEKPTLPKTDSSGCSGITPESKDNLQPVSQETQYQGISSEHDSNSPSQNHSPSLSTSTSEQDATLTKSTIVQSQIDRETPPKTVSQPYPENYNTPVRPILKNALNLWLNGEALLWQATEENLTYVYKTDLDNRVDLKTLDFEWDWGFRVSGGYNIPRDGWGLSLMWTHLENHASNSQKAHLDANGNGIGSMPFLQAAWGLNDTSPPAGIISKATTHWTVHLDQVDLKIGREYYVGKHLTLTPYAGLRTDWIDQNYKTTYHFFSTFHPQKFTMDNRFWGFGFFGGTDSDWLLGKGFSLFGTADFAILLSFFKIDQQVRQIDNSGGLTKDTLDNSFRCGRWVLDLNLGLKWSRLFSHDSWGLTFKAGYEYHLYFDQNELSNLTSVTPTVRYTKPMGNLIYQGVSLSGQIDF